MCTCLDNHQTQCAIEVWRHLPWPLVNCHGCWFTHSQFHSRQYKPSENPEIYNIGAHAQWFCVNRHPWQQSGSDELPSDSAFIQTLIRHYSPLHHHLKHYVICSLHEYGMQIVSWSCHRNNRRQKELLDIWREAFFLYVDGKQARIVWDTLVTYDTWNFLPLFQ